MLNHNEKTLLESFEGNFNLKEWIFQVQKSTNPYFLQESATLYNWNDGYELPIAIANNPFCDQGTALNLHWLSAGIALHTEENIRNEENKEWVAFCELIEKRILNQFYKMGPISFKPPISKVTTFKYKKRGIPTVLYTPFNGKTMI
ncbi:DUF4274 domain-containing protein [Flammeovirga sp. EKP202]|uniref:DUF4274 domain-containing protein n=1 Tax=Flammeovirga sp. EKP202 TaxID=2770592 RepID=UPI00165F0368|nr:DUF4274 domain-containing protein [Flammeovirga sp. EKP202]MBD0404333.1 DUF4274 domain-containing protein [Flammeovirga sp. EKP202]